MIGVSERASSRQGLKVEQQRAKAVSVFFGRAVIDLKPAFGCPDWRRSRANAGAVPVPLAAMGQATVSAPVNEVGRFGQPNIIAAQFRAAGSVERVVFVRRFAPRRERSPCCAEERSCPHWTKSFQSRVVRSPTPTPLLETCV